MKVYIAVNDYDYEGYGEPLGIFTSLEKAEEHIALLRMIKYKCSAPVDIFESDLDSPDTGGMDLVKRFERQR